MQLFKPFSNTCTIWILLSSKFNARKEYTMSDTHPHSLERYSPDLFTAATCSTRDEMIMNARDGMLGGITDLSLLALGDIINTCPPNSEEFIALFAGLRRRGSVAAMFPLDVGGDKSTLDALRDGRFDDLADGDGRLWRSCLRIISTTLLSAPDGVPRVYYVGGGSNIPHIYTRRPADGGSMAILRDFEPIPANIPCKH